VVRVGAQPIPVVLIVLAPTRTTRRTGGEPIENGGHRRLELRADEEHLGLRIVDPYSISAAVSPEVDRDVHRADLRAGQGDLQAGRMVRSSTAPARPG